MNTRDFVEIDHFIEEQMARLSIPGAALAIVAGDHIVHLRGFGKAHPGGAAPTSQTPFFIGSLTKSFTALALMQLVEAGKVELDAPVQRYLPWFSVPVQRAVKEPERLSTADPQAAGRITVRHLLNQNSGFSTWSGWIPLDDLAGRPERALSKIQLKHPVGAAFEYSNLNYVLLGLILEAVSGETYADYVQAHIFNPLGMCHTYTTEAVARPNGLAVGWRYWFWRPFVSPNLPVPRSSLPGGGLISSAEDLGRYLIFQLNEGNCGDPQVLSPSGIAEMHRPAAPIDIMGWTAHYGMGWYNEALGSTRLVWHGGTMPNFASFAALFPEQKKGFVLLLNADHYLMNPVITEIGHSLAARLAGQPPQPGPLGFSFARFAPWLARALLLIPLLQILGVVSTTRRLRQWSRDPQSRPSRGGIAQHVLLPLIPNLGFAAVPVYLRAKQRLGFLLDYFPDLAWIAVLGGAFAGIWAFLRTGLVLRALRRR